MRKLILLFFSLSTFSFSFAQSLLQKIDIIVHRELATFPGNDDPQILALDSIIHKVNRVEQGDSVVYSLVSELGLLFMERGRFISAIELYSLMISDLKKKPESVSNSLLIAKSNITLGAAFEEIGLWNMAMDIYHEALTIIEKYNFHKEKCKIINNRGTIYFKRGEHKRAEEQFLRAVEISTKHNYKDELIINYNNLASVSLSNKNPQKALDYTLNALHLVDKDKDPYVYSFLRATIATIYIELKEYTIAESHLKQAIEYEFRFNFEKDLAEAYLSLSLIYEKTFKIQLAFEYLGKAMIIANKLDNTLLKVSILNQRSEIYAAQKNFDKAYQDLKVASDFKDKISEQDNKRKLSDLELLYEAEKKIQMNDLLVKEVSLQKLNTRRQLILNVVLFLFSILLVVFFFYRSKVEKRTRKANELIRLQEDQLHEQQKYISQQKEKELEITIEQKNRELASKVLNLVKNNEFILSLNQELKQLLLELNPKEVKKRDHLREILSKLKQQSNSGSWEEFHFFFTQVYSAFYDNLSADFSNLTHKELRLCAFLRIGLSTKEISAITFREVRSIDSARNRLRKKFNLAPEENLVEFLAKY